MNIDFNNLSDEVIKILDNLTSRFGIVIDWANENVAPYIQELSQRIIQYEIATSIVWIIISVIILACYFIIFFVNWRKFSEGNLSNTSDCLFIGFLIIGSCIAFAFIIAMIKQVFDIVQAIYFPEKTIFEYVSRCLSNNQ